MFKKKKQNQNPKPKPNKPHHISLLLQNIAEVPLCIGRDLLICSSLFQCYKCFWMVFFRSTLQDLLFI